jgi:hypothetical protein
LGVSHNNEAASERNRKIQEAQEALRERISKYPLQDRFLIRCEDAATAQFFNYCKLAAVLSPSLNDWISSHTVDEIYFFKR